MRLIKTVILKQGRFNPIESPVTGYNPATRERGTFETAAAHGCRHTSCTQHWQHETLPSREITVEVTFDEHKIAEDLAHTAARNKTGRAVQYSGLLKAKVVRSK